MRYTFYFMTITDARSAFLLNSDAGTLGSFYHYFFVAVIGQACKLLRWSFVYLIFFCNIQFESSLDTY